MDSRRRRSDLRFDEWSGSGDGGLVVYDPVTDAGHLLNPATAAVFEACDGHTPVGQVAELVASRSDLPADPGIVDLALAELDEAGLLEPAVGAGPADEPRGMSRRSVIARLALGAGAIALLPVIDTVAGSSQLAAETPSRAAVVIPPTADPKSATTPPGTPVDITLSTSGGFVSPTSTVFAIASQPTHGGVTLVDNVATYTPADGFSGTDTFTYIAAQCIAFADGLPSCPAETGPYPETGTAPATVTITVPAPPSTTSTVAPTTTAESKPAVAAKAQPSFTG